MADSIVLNCNTAGESAKRMCRNARLDPSPARSPASPPLNPGNALRGRESQNRLLTLVTIRGKVYVDF
jgi:hypothetical protein